MNEKLRDTTITINFDGVDYPIDVANLTGRETGILKRVGHIKGISEILDAIKYGDMEVVVALTGIAMQRKGINPVNYDYLLDQSIEKFELIFPESSDNPLAVTEQESSEKVMTSGTSGTLS